MMPNEFEYDAIFFDPHALFFAPYVAE